MTVSMTAGASVTQDKLGSEIHAPRLQLVRLEILDGALGNGNGEPDEGEVFDLKCWVKNYGSGRVDGLNAVLQSSSPNITILQGTSSYGTLNPVTEAAEVTLFRPAGKLPDGERRQPAPHRQPRPSGRRAVRVPPPAAPFGIALDPSIVRRPCKPPGRPVARRGSRRLSRATGRSLPRDRGHAPRPTTSSASPRSAIPVCPRTRATGTTCTSIDSAGNEKRPFTPVSSVSTNPPQLAGWPIAMQSETSSSPAVGDLDGDGTPEIVKATRTCTPGTAMARRSSMPMPTRRAGACSRPRPASSPRRWRSGELDGTAGLEVVACNWENNQIYAIDGDGDLLWMRQPSNGGTPVTGAHAGDRRRRPRRPQRDLRAEQRWQAVRLASRRLAALVGPSGRLVREHRRVREKLAALGNLDTDFDLEIVETDAAGNLYAWNRDGSNLPGFPKVYGVAFYNSPALGDVNGDGKLDIVAIHQSGSNNLHCLKSDGTELAGFPITVTLKSAAVSPSPALADFDNDGKLEIVVGSNEFDPSQSKVYVYRWNGTLYPGWPQSTNSDTESSPIVADFDADGHPDIVYGGQDGVLHGWKRDGTELLGFPLSVGDFVRGTPTAADVRRRRRSRSRSGGLGSRNLYVWGFPERLVGELGAVAERTCTTRSARIAMDSKSPMRPTVGIRRSPAPPARSSWARTCRTRSIPRRRSSSACRPAGPVQLDIYDVSGHRVRGLVNGNFTAGRHRILWDGRDDHGHTAASGIYFYRLQWDNQSIARRMVLLR
jgi:hypothetical protein